MKNSNGTRRKEVEKTQTHHLMNKITFLMKRSDFVYGSSEVTIYLNVIDGRLWEPEDEQLNQTEKAFSEVKRYSPLEIPVVFFLFCVRLFKLDKLDLVYYCQPNMTEV